MKSVLDYERPARRRGWTLPEWRDPLWGGVLVIGGGVLAVAGAFMTAMSGMVDGLGAAGLWTLAGSVVVIATGLWRVGLWL